MSRVPGTLMLPSRLNNKPCFTFMKRGFFFLIPSWQSVQHFSHTESRKEVVVLGLYLLIGRFNVLADHAMLHC